MVIGKTRADIGYQLKHHSNVCLSSIQLCFTISDQQDNWEEMLELLPGRSEMDITEMCRDIHEMLEQEDMDKIDGLLAIVFKIVLLVQSFYQNRNKI